MSRYFKSIRGGILLLACLGIIAQPPAYARAADPVRIALILSQTGIAAEENIPAAAAAELAVEEINNRGGLLGRPLRLITIDNGSTPLRSKQAAEKAVNLGVVTVIGAYRSSHSMPMARVLQNARIPMISPSSTKPAITLTGDCIFRACYIDSFQGHAMARFALNDLGAETAVVLTNSSEEYSLTLAKYFVNSFTRAGGKVLWEGTYKGTAVDFTEVLSRVKQIRPRILFIPGYSRDSGLLIRQAVNMGIDSIFMGGDAWGNKILEYAGDALEGSFYSSQYHPSLPFPENLHLKRLYRERFNVREIINMRIPLTYDSVMLFADAVRRAGSLDPEGIREALANTTNFRGATGTVTFDRNGDPLNKETSILKFENGSWKFVKSVMPLDFSPVP